MTAISNPMKELAVEVLKRAISDVDIQFARPNCPALEFWCDVAEVNKKLVTEAIIERAERRGLISELDAINFYNVNVDEVRANFEARKIAGRKEKARLAYLKKKQKEIPQWR